MSPETGEVLTTRLPGRSAGYAGCVVLLTLLFIKPLVRLVQYAAGSDLHSHVILVPFITAYLLYIGRGRMQVVYRSSVWGTVILSGLGAAAPSPQQRGAAH